MAHFIKSTRQILLAFVLVITIWYNGQAQEKPNILVIFGDDIGQSNVSAYTFG